jgi:hypothetical protein
MMLTRPCEGANRRHLQACLLAMVAVFGGGPAFPEPPTAASLDTPLNGSWTGVPLRAWLEQLSQPAGRPVILDRRLDPDLHVTRQCRGEPLGTALAEVAARIDADVVDLRSTIRLAPRGVAAACSQAEATRDRELTALPRRQRAVPQSTRAWTWPDGARPADLVAAVAADAKLTVAGLETIPHDHLAGRVLPPLTLAERLDLVLADFDKRIAWRPAAAGATPTAAIVPLTDGATPSTAAKPSRVPAQRQPAPAGPARFTLRAAAPLDQLLASVSGQLGLTLVLDRDALAARGIAAAEIVRLEVSDASREQLLDAIVTPLRLTWRIDGDTLRVGGATAAEK